MYNPKTIKQQFATLVGIRQTDNPDFSPIPESLVYDDDSDKIQITHPLITIENIDATARNYSKYQYPAWNGGTSYVQGARVSFSNKSYEAKQASTGQQPDTSAADWKELNLLDQFITDIFLAAGEDVVQQVIIEKKLAKQVKSVLSSVTAFSGAGTMTDYILNQGSLVGYKITLPHRNNILCIIQRIGLQLTAAQDDLTLYLYHTSQVEPIATIQIDQTKVNSFEWHEANLRLNYLSEDLDAGGAYYLMYDQNDLVGQAIKKKLNLNNPPCSYCNPQDVTDWNNYSRFFRLQAVEVLAANRNTDDDLLLWDITKTKNVPDTNFGLNFEMSARCDITRLLVQNKDLFGYAMRDVATKKFLEAMANSTRQNNAQTKVDVMARAELTAGVAGGMNFQSQVSNQIKAVGFDIADLDPLCMPCSKSVGIRHGVAGFS